MQAPDGTEGRKARCPACSAITRIPVAAIVAAGSVVRSAPEVAVDSPPAESDNPFAAPSTTDFSETIDQPSRRTNDTPAWENEASIGNFFKSTKEVLFSPSQTFRHFNRQGTMGRALGYAGVAGAIMGALCGLTEMVSCLGDPDFDLVFWLGLVFGFAAGMPVLATVGCWIYGGMVHLLLWMFGAKKYSLSATVRSVCYTQMSAWPFFLVPFILTSRISGLWLLVIQIKGLAELHDTTNSRVALAVLTPVLLLVILIVAASMVNG